MTATATPESGAVNCIGLSKADYNGSNSTLCNGCGHFSIANVLIGTAYDLSLDPTRIAKFSGIGCSSKSPAYFLGRSHSINGLHGRMPSLATGATTVNKDLVAIGVSGDGDTVIEKSLMMSLPVPAEDAIFGSEMVIFTPYANSAHMMQFTFVLFR